MKWTINKKLLGGFSAVLLLLIITIGICYIQITAIDDSYTDLLKDKAIKNVEIRELQVAVKQEIVTMRGYLIVGDNEAYQAYSNATSNYEKAYNTLLPKFKRPEFIKMVEDINQVHSEYVQFTEKVFDLKKQGKNREYEILVSTEERDIVAKLDAEVAKLSEHQNNLLIEGSNSNAKKVQKTILLFFFIGSWISLLMVVFIIDYMDQHQQIQQELQRADKLNVISQLAASVAHEVRNPLTTVQGFLQLMSSEPQVHHNHKNYIDISLRELNDAQSIINDYLSLAKPHTEGLSSINLSAEVKNAVSLINSYSNIKDIRIESSIQDSLYMNGNRAELKQILVNIMKNGIEAMRDNGLLTVRLYSNLEEIVIEIIDTGMGMTKEQIHKVGTPFYSTKDKGTGVGLTISYQLVHSMKGKVGIESERGKGTKFTIRFPCYG